MNEIENLKQRIDKLEQIVNFFTRPDSYTFEKPVIQFKNSKTGFNRVPPVSLTDVAPIGRQDTSGTGGSAVVLGTGLNGNTGTSYYTIGDIVYALKKLGLLQL